MNDAKKTNAAKVATKKGGSGGTFAHFTNARKDETKYSRFADREKLKEEGKCYICQKAGHMANECLEKKRVSSTF